MQSEPVVTAPPGEWRHPDDYPPPRGKIILILSRYGVASGSRIEETITGRREIEMIVTTDGKVWEDDEYKLVGCVDKVRSRNLITPPIVGKFPVFIDRKTTRMFTYSKKIAKIGD